MAPKLILHSFRSDHLNLEFKGPSRFENLIVVSQHESHVPIELTVMSQQKDGAVGVQLRTNIYRISIHNCDTLKNKCCRGTILVTRFFSERKTTETLIKEHTAILK